MCCQTYNCVQKLDFWFFFFSFLVVNNKTESHCAVRSGLWPSGTSGLTLSCLFGRFFSRSAESNWSWGGAADLRRFRRGGHAVFFRQQRHWRGLASTATRQGGTKVWHRSSCNLTHFRTERSNKKKKRAFFMCECKANFNNECKI